MKLEDVLAAADAISSTGAPPTLKAVRDYLGGGSYSDIGPFLKVWRANRADENETAGSPPIPDVVQRAVTTTIDEIWKAGLQLARNEYESDRSALVAERLTMRETEAELAALADTLGVELEVQRSENSLLKAQLVEMQRLLSESSGRTKQLQELFDKQLAAGTRLRKAVD
jgi:hypothetical protein